MDEPGHPSEHTGKGEPGPLPSGAHLVCPRCGAGVGDSRWCAGCGLNLAQQDELPTAGAYAAKVREQRWLEDEQHRRQAAEAETHKAEAERAERAAAESKRRDVEQQERERAEMAAQKQQRAAAKHERRERRRARLRHPMLLVPLAVLAAGAIAAIVTTASRGGHSPARRSANTHVGGAPGRSRASTPSPRAVALAVRNCPTTYGVQPTTPPTVPTAIKPDAPLPSTAAVVFYANSVFAVLAPKGWSCKSTVGADGSTTLSVTSPSTSDEVIAADTGGGCVGCNADAACPFFSSAVAALPAPPCPSTIPAGEKVDRVQATVVGFQDPANVKGHGADSGGGNPANAVMIYRHGTELDESCTLPQSEHPLCTAILDDFLARHNASPNPSQTSTPITSPGLPASSAPQPSSALAATATTSCEYGTAYVAPGTSCAFGITVSIEYGRAVNANATNMPSHITATSSATGRAYTMACAETAGTTIVCTGGEGAVVRFTQPQPCNANHSASARCATVANPYCQMGTCYYSAPPSDKCAPGWTYQAQQAGVTAPGSCTKPLA